MFVFLNENNELVVGKYICYMDLTRVLMSYGEQKVCVVHETTLVAFCADAHAYLKEPQKIDENGDIISRLS